MLLSREMPIQLSEELKRALHFLLKDRVADVFASLVYGAYAGGYADERSAIDILVITGSKRTTLRCQSEWLADKKVRLLIVDRNSFENDIKYEYFGGIFSENLITPYEPIMGIEYLWSQEVKVKKNIVNNILTNLVLGFPEMSRDFLIEPEYFIYEYLTRRAILFPPISYRFINILRGKEKEKNISRMIRGFRAAIDELIDEGALCTTNERFLKMTDEYITKVKEKRGYYLVGLFNVVRANIIRYILGIFPEIRESLLDENRIYSTYHSKDFSKKSLKALENPRKYIFIPTALGIIPFTEKISIKEIVRKFLTKNSIFACSVKKLGGVLNSVYVLRFFDDNKERKFVVKIFKDWYGWKWFPITIWTLGTRNFAVLGKTRLEKEYTINRFLSSHGINVPAIIYVSPEEKIIIQEHIEGAAASKVIKQLCRAGEEKRNLLEVIRKIGCEIAKIHMLGVSIGDCKPENIIVADDGRIFFVDLEQAERGGDQVWDIAEFLYYSGHYILLPANMVEEIVREFINGYIISNGNLENVKRALSLKYMRVFSFFTPPHILLTIVNSCKNLLKTLNYKRLGGVQVGG
ncbi:MAG: lipopolysaccharide kinase InaA family protein [Candidatus Bathyarchaeia archaeon]